MPSAAQQECPEGGRHEPMHDDEGVSCRWCRTPMKLPDTAARHSADPQRAGRRRWTFNERFVIGQPGNPMMERWRLLQTPLFGVYVHFIYREDLDPVPHDHPWQFWSFVLRGGYTEYQYPDARVWGDNELRDYRRCSFHRFPLRAAHRIVSVLPKTVTLVIVGRKLRTWGFWSDGQWTDYRDALNLRPTEGDARKRPRTGEANDPPVLVDHGVTHE